MSNIKVIQTDIVKLKIKNRMERLVKNKIILILLSDLFLAFIVFALSFLQIFKNIAMPDFFVLLCLFSGLIISFFIDIKKLLFFVKNAIFSALVFGASLGTAFSICTIGDKIPEISVLESFFRGFLFIFVPAFVLFLIGAITRLVANRLAVMVNIVKK